MYTIVMDKYKNLNTTVKTMIYQQENLADKIQFLLPPQYQDNDIKEFVVTLKYVDPNGNFHSEILTVDEDLYKDYLRYVLPVTTQLTQVAGTITIRLTLTRFVNSGDVMNINKIETNSTTIRIDKPTGFTDNVNFEDIEAWKAQMSQMTNDINNMQDTMPNDLIIAEDDDKLHLSHDGEAIGKGVDVMIPATPDDDGSRNGVIEVDDLPEDDAEVYEDENSSFIEV